MVSLELSCRATVHVAHVGLCLQRILQQVRVAATALLLPSSPGRTKSVRISQPSNLVQLDSDRIACTVAQYNASNPQPSHFTQVVWKGTTQVGCAVATCNNIFPAKYGPAKYYVCEYYPQGNIIGQFPCVVTASFLIYLALTQSSLYSQNVFV